LAVSAEASVEFGAKIKTALALERFEEVRVPRGKEGREGGQCLEKAPAAGLGLPHQTTMDAETQPVLIGELMANAPVLAGGDEIERGSKESGGEGGAGRVYNSHKNKKSRAS
jgi:hypothetical protein